MMKNKVWMKKTGRKWVDKFDNIVCDNCGYHNKKIFIEKSGVCNGCGKVLDEKAKFKADMNNKLHLWRNKRWKW